MGSVATRQVALEVDWSRPTVWRWWGRQSAGKLSSATAPTRCSKTWQPRGLSTAGRAKSLCRHWPPVKPASCRSRHSFRSLVCIMCRCGFPPDDLPGDNQRWDVVDVNENLHLLLVDGEPSAEPFQGETDFLGLALSLAIGESRAFQVEVVTDAEWAASARTDPDLIVLANVASLTPAQVELLRKQVEAGAGLDRLSRRPGRSRKLQSAVVSGRRGTPAGPARCSRLTSRSQASCWKRTLPRPSMRCGSSARPCSSGSKSTNATSCGSRRTKTRRSAFCALERLGFVPGTCSRKTVGRGRVLLVDDCRRQELERLADRTQLRAGDARDGQSGRPHQFGDRTS